MPILEKPEAHTIQLLQAIRDDMKKRFDHLDEKTDDLSFAVGELRKTQSAMLELISSHDNHLARIQGDMVQIKKRLAMADV